MRSLKAAQLDERLRILLPEQYRETYEELEPAPMRSAGLRFVDGEVAWDQIWGSFCDLAMAGGPPHRGSLLAPGSPASIDTAPDRYRAVTAEICRGLHLVSGLYAEPAAEPGWVQMYCTSAAMTGWLARAIVIENVSAHVRGLALLLPAGPEYRLEKEIRNVVTVVAKTTHYWTGHKTAAQQDAVAALLREMGTEGPFLQSSLKPEPVSVATGFAALRATCPGWLGVTCADSRVATQVMRLLVVTNVLARREDAVVYVPVDPFADPAGEHVLERVQNAIAMAKGESA